jgi:uncharacterized protein YndB with AHSA1/START domain
MPTKKSLIEYPSDREMVFTRSFDAPRELVWAAYTDPQQVVRWWGPKGFTNTIHEMDVRPGGLWRLTMHGPDSTDHPNRIEFIDVVKPERLVYHHGDDGNPHMFHVTTNFITEGDRTKFVSRMAFKTAAECAETRKFAIDGHNSTMERLDEQLAKMAAESREIVSARVFAAPRESVFNAFADPARLPRWWGPKGFTNTIHQFDLKPGGRCRLTMHGPNGADYHNEKEFTEVVKPERIVFQHLEPMHRFQMTMLFAEEGGKTRLTWRMLFESAAEASRLRSFISEANEQNFDRLAAHLAATV